MRLPNGWRVRRLMPERVHFGKAVDVAHAQAVRYVMQGAELGDVQAKVPALAELGYYAAMAEQPWADDTGQEYTPDDEERAVFFTQLSNSLMILTGLAPNRLPKGTPEPAQPVPLLQATDLRAPGWTMHVQGMDGKTLEVPGVFGDRALGCTPDYVLSDESGLLAGWLDVKATDRAFSYPAKWQSAEAVIYTYALLRLNEGVPPRLAGYQEYRRNVKPYWMTTVVTPEAAWFRLAEHYVLRWNKALATDDADNLQFNTKNCAKCVFRQAVPDTDHKGCPVGQAVEAMGLEVTGD